MIHPNPITASTDTSSTNASDADNLIKLKTQIHELCTLYNINYPINIIAVSKTVLASRVFELYTKYSQTAFAENYVKELSSKVDELDKLLLTDTKSYNTESHLECGKNELEWHFIGNIQSNKIKEISQKSSWVQSLEKIKHAQLINTHRLTTQSKLNILIEVNISEESNKRGLQTLDEVISLANVVKQLPNLQLRGLMGIASNTADENIIFKQFSHLKSIYDELNASGYQLDTLSMGMSHDYHIAIQCGANMLRIGSKIFGERNYEI